MAGVNARMKRLLKRIHDHPGIAMPHPAIPPHQRGDLSLCPVADGVMVFPESFFFNSEDYITIYTDFFDFTYPASPVLRDVDTGRPIRVTPPHRHDFFELAYLFAGSMRVCVEGREFAMRPGQMCLYDLRAAHSFTMEGEDTVLINVLVRQSAFEQMILPIAFRSSLYGFVTDALSRDSAEAACLLFDIPADSSRQQLMLRLLEEHVRHDGHSGQIMLFTLLTLLSEIGREGGENLLEPPVKPESAPNRLSATDILRYIRGSYDVATLDDASRYLNYSREYISRTLLTQTGRSFSDWRQEYRLDIARMRLRESSLSVESIARSVGYSERRTFDRAFKQRFGLTPAHYREAEGRD